MNTNKELADKISNCFADVDFTRQQFKVNGDLLDADGETKFYKVSEIDKGIEKLNALLKEMSKESKE